MKKVVYVFLSEGGIDQLIYNIIPQIATATHPLAVVGMCFFDENAKILEQTEIVGRQLAKLGIELGITFMIAESRDLEKTAALNCQLSKRLVTPAECPVIIVENGQQTGCFPDLHSALGNNQPDHIISL